MVLDFQALKGLGLKSLWHCDVNLKPSSPFMVPYSLYPAQKFSITYDFLAYLCMKQNLYGTLHLGTIGTRAEVTLALRCKFKT